MKVLFLSQGKQISDHPGWHDALEKLKNEGEVLDFLNIPYFGYAEKYGWENFYNEVVNICRNEKFDLVYFHYFHRKRKPSPRKCIETLLALPDRTIIITSSGDPFSDNWMQMDYPEDFKEASRLADITFSTQMGKASDKMIKWGAKNVVFSPNGMCQVRFKALRVDLEKHKFEFDATFVGSKNSTRLFNPISKHWWGAKKRQKLVSLFSKEIGDKFGLFGNYWANKFSKGPIPFNEQQKIFQRGKVLIDAPPYSTSDFYTSNRPFMQIASGVPTILYDVPRLNRIFRENYHCYFVKNQYEALSMLRKLLASDEKILYKKAEEAAKYIEQNHTQYHRMKFKIDTVKRYIANNYKLDVHFPFFLPEVNLEEERRFATRSIF